MAKGDVSSSIVWQHTIWRLLSKDQQLAAATSVAPVFKEEFCLGQSEENGLGDVQTTCFANGSSRHWNMYS
jgi:hypothetical protein